MAKNVTGRSPEAAGPSCNGVLEIRLPIAAKADSTTFKVELAEGAFASVGQN